MTTDLATRLSDEADQCRNDGADDIARLLDEAAAALRQPGPSGWSVFNTGAEVVGGLSLADAIDYLTPSRLERGWSAVCVIDKDNPPSDALSEQQADPVAVTAGWKLVPVEPTEDMLHSLAGHPMLAVTREAYAAMLSATPAAPAAQALTDEQVKRGWSGQGGGNV